MSQERREAQAFAEFVKVVAKLRDPNGGCPWDLEQTHHSIRPYLVEEAYEVLEAIDELDDVELCRELGDLLLQVVLHAQIAQDRGAFSIGDVVEAIAEKIVRRHPHVFGEVKASNALEASQSWELQKLKEKGAQGEKKSLFAGVPVSLPSLLRAHRISEKASHVGFDWSEFPQVMSKVEEETEELQHEIRIADVIALKKPVSATGSLPPEKREALEHEMGDLLFSLVQVARWLGLSPEDCLRRCCDRFEKRFELMRETVSRPLDTLSLDELESAWEKAKKSLTEHASAEQN